MNKDTKWLDVGCDLAFDSLTKHRNIHNLVLTSANNLPFGSSTFNLVTCNMVVEHLDNPEKTFCELARVLSPGGQLIIHTPNLLNYAVFLNHTVARRLPRDFVLRLIKWAENRRKEDVFPTFYRANTVHRLSQICRRFDLKEESCRILTSPQPFFSFFCPLAFIQILLMRLTMSRYFRKFGSTILMVMKYKPAGEESSDEADPRLKKQTLSTA